MGTINDENYTNKKTPKQLPSDQEKFRSFIFLLIGQLTSLFGSSIVMFAIIWWITVETESATILSITSFLSFAPIIILIPFTGVYADRWNKKKIIIVADLLQALLTLGIIILFTFGTINFIPMLILIALRGVCQAFHQPAIAAIIPFMVPQRYLLKINSISYLLMGLLNVLSPVIAASLIIFLTIGQILWVDIITFSIALVPSIFLKLPFVKVRKKKKSKFKKEFKEGLLAIKEINGLISLLMIFAVVSFFTVPFYILNPYYITVTHSGTAFDLALVSALFEVGVVVGAIIMFIKKNWHKHVRTMIRLMYFQLIGAFFYLLPPKGAFWLIGMGPLILGLTTAIINALIMTLFQTIIPPRKQGRAISIIIVITSSVSPLGMILSGLFADLIGIYFLFWLCVIIMVGIITIGVFFTKILNVDAYAEDKMNKVPPSEKIAKNGVNAEECISEIQTRLKDKEI